MLKKLKSILLIAGLTSLGLAQFRATLPERSLPSAVNGDIPSQRSSIFDASRFSIQHGFSMSMINVQGQNLSVGAYQNEMSFLLSDNLQLRTQLVLMNNGLLTNRQSAGGLAGQLYYGASLDYRPTKNTLFQINFYNFPTYRSQPLSPFSLRAY